MKKLCIFVLLFLISDSILGQELRFAPVVGLNVTNNLFSKTYKSSIESEFGGDAIKFQPLLRFSIGGLVDYLYNETTSFRSGLLINMKGSNIKVNTEYDGYKINSKSRYTISYLEIPLALAYRFGESGFVLTGGPQIGFAVAGRITSKGTIAYLGDTESFDESVKLEVGGKNVEDGVKPIDISINLGIGKVTMLAERPLEVSVNIQPSLTSWNNSSKSDSDLWVRNLVIGFRAAYFFSVK